MDHKCPDETCSTETNCRVEEMPLVGNGLCLIFFCEICDICLSEKFLKNGNIRISVCGQLVILVILLMKRRSFGYSLLTISHRKTKLVQRVVTSTTAERHHRLLKASVTFPTFPPHWLTEHKERELNFTILVKKRGLLHDTKHTKDTMARSEDKYLNSSTSGSEAKLRCGTTTTSHLTPFRLIMMY